MAVIETWIKTDLKSIVKVNMFHGILFSQDNMANLIGVELLDGGEPATVTGSVSANVLRADGTTVAVSGTLSGNKASVTLPQAAYAVPGMLAIVIKLTADSTVTTIGAIQSIVYRASTDTIIDPGTIIPSVQDLIAAIDAAVDSIPPDYSALTAEVGDLKNATNVSLNGTIAFSGSWEIGNISSSTGNNSNDNKAIRTIGKTAYVPGTYLQFTGVLRGSGETADRIAYVYYYKNNGATYDSRKLINDGVAVTLPDGTTHYRLTYGYTSASGGTVSDLSAMVADYGLNIISKIDHDITAELAEKQGYIDLLEEKTENLIFASDSDYIKYLADPPGETYRNVTYTWTGKTCHVVTGTGGATNMSYTDVFADASHLPEGIVPGETYRVIFDGDKVQLRLYYAHDNTFESVSIYNSTKSGYVTMPSNSTGMRARLYVESGAVVDEYVTPVITRSDMAQRTVFPHKIAFFGDSITAGRDGDESAGVHTAYPFPETVAKRLGVVCDNYGVGSMGYLPTTSLPNDCAYTKISGTDLSTYDVIVMCFGVNDGFHPIGNYNSTDETEVMGQFNKIVNYVFTQKPAVQLIVIAPFNGCNAGSFPKYWYGNPGGQAYSRGTLSDTLKQACEYYNIPYIEQKNSPLNGFTVKKDILDGNNKSLTYMGADGVHPSNEGYKAIGGWLAGELARLI